MRTGPDADCQRIDCWARLSCDSIEIHGGIVLIHLSAVAFQAVHVEKTSTLVFAQMKFLKRDAVG